MNEFEKELIGSLNKIAEGLENIASGLVDVAGAMPDIPTNDGKAMTHLVECFHHEFPVEFYIHNEEAE